MFAGLLKSFTTVCACARVSNRSIWLSSTSGPSARDFVPLVGEFGGFWFAVRVLTCWYIYPAVFMHSEMPCVSVRMFAMPAWLFGSTQLFVGRLTDSTSELNSFAVSRYVLTVFLASAAIYMLLRIPGMSLCALDPSNKFPKSHLGQLDHVSNL